MILVRINHREFTTESNSTKLSIIRFCESTSASGSHRATRVGAYLVAFFKEYLIILTQCHAEDDRSDILETMDPLLPLTSLTANVKHATYS